MSLEPKTSRNNRKGWILIALIAIPTLIAMILGVVHGAKSQNVWKEKEPQWIKEGQAFGKTHSAHECVDETLKKDLSHCANQLPSITNNYQLKTYVNNSTFNSKLLLNIYSESPKF